jgi:hypothetical protein
MVTVPVDEDPVATDVGLRVRAVTVGAVMPKVPVPLLEFSVAVTVAVRLVATAVVVAVKVVLVAPDGTVTELGTTALAVLLERLTTWPEEAALLVIVIVPVEETVPKTVEGLKINEENVGAVTVSVAVRLVPESVALITGEASAVTAEVVIVNVAVVAPDATVTELGTAALLRLLLREIDSPLVGAALLIVTVPVEDVPPGTEVGDTEMAVKVGALIVRVAVFDELFAVAVMVAVVFVATATVDTLNVAVVAPEATVTELGTVADALLLERLTV